MSFWSRKQYFLSQWNYVISILQVCFPFITTVKQIQKLYAPSKCVCEVIFVNINIAILLMPFIELSLLAYVCKSKPFVVVLVGGGGCFFLLHPQIHSSIKKCPFHFFSYHWNNNKKTKQWSFLCDRAKAAFA